MRSGLRLPFWAQRGKQDEANKTRQTRRGKQDEAKNTRQRAANQAYPEPCRRARYFPRNASPPSKRHPLVHNTKRRPNKPDRTRHGTPTWRQIQREKRGRILTMTRYLRAPITEACLQSIKHTHPPRVTLQRQKSVATHTSSDNASEKISKLQKFTHERLTQALLRRPLPPYAAQQAASWPNEMLSHQSTGHLDAITEPFNSDSSAANGIHEFR